MKKKSRFIATLLAVLMLVSVLSINAFAEEAEAPNADYIIADLSEMSVSATSDDNLEIDMHYDGGDPLARAESGLGRWYNYNGYYKFWVNNHWATGWWTIDNKVYYFDNNGWMATGWKQFGNHWFYFSSSGAMCEGWQQIGGYWYYFTRLEDDSDLAHGEMLSSGWLDEGSTGNTYYFNSKGQLYQNCWIRDRYDTNYWIYATSSGALATGWQKINGSWYYFEPTYYTDYSDIFDTYQMYYSINAFDYHFAANGVATPRAYWQSNSTGYWYVRDGQYVTGWEFIDGYWYYFYSNGYMATGWVEFDGGWCYFDSSGHQALEGWKQIGNKWYYFERVNYNGGYDYFAACDEFLMINGSGYYFTDDCSMATNAWIRDAAGEYCFATSSGALATGWQKIGGYWYYFYSDYTMAKNTYVDGCWLNGSGQWV